MSSSTPPKPLPSPVAPPDEAFWDRYSAHHEFPLSGVGSIALHVLALAAVAGLLLLLARSLVSDKTPVPIAGVVSLNGDDSENKGGGEGSEKQEAVDPLTNPSTPSRPIPEADLAKIDPLKEWTPKVPALDEGLRPEDLPAAQKISKMNEELRQALIDGMKGRGNGAKNGDGSGNSGQPGVGSGNGDPTSSANRALRWDLNFNTREDSYLKQLAAMKANLVIQQPPDWKTTKIYRKIPEATSEPFSMDDVQGRVYFVDDNPASVSAVSRALALGFDPPRFIAIFPKEIEAELAQKEREYRNRKESEIFSTSFRVLVRDGKLTITVIDQKPVTGRGRE